MRVIPLLRTPQGLPSQDKEMPKSPEGAVWSAAYPPAASLIPSPNAPSPPPPCASCRQLLAFSEYSKHAPASRILSLLSPLTWIVSPRKSRVTSFQFLQVSAQVSTKPWGHPQTYLPNYITLSSTPTSMPHPLLGFLFLHNACHACFCCVFTCFFIGCSSLPCPESKNYEDKGLCWFQYYPSSYQIGIARSRYSKKICWPKKWILCICNFIVH